MGERARDVLRVERAVDVARGVDALHDRRRPRAEAAAPGGVGRGPFGWRRALAANHVGELVGEDVVSSRSVIGALTVLLVLCGAALGVMLWRQAPSEPALQQPQAGTAASSLGHFIALDGKLPAPALAFQARDGTEKHLADFKGQ